MNARLPSALRLEPQALQSHVDAAWRERIVPELVRYIEVPAKSPMFDPDWAAHGLLERVLQSAADWVRAQQVPGLQLEILRLNDVQGRPRTPVMFFEIPASEGVGTSDPAPGRPKPGQPPRGAATREAAERGSSCPSGQTVLMYGHMDKQPEFNGWRSDLGPWTPKIDDGKLYGRGGADDGYAVYASIAAIQALKAQGAAHPRIVGLIETSEESGSADLLPYVDALKTRLGDVGLVICLDSGAGNYDQLWLTTSLRGMASGVLKVEILTEGIHSGDASGLVPSSFRIMRQVLDRLEDSGTGRLLPASFHSEVPRERMAQAHATAAILGDELFKRFPWAHHDCGGATVSALPTTTDPVEALLARTWRPALSVTGAEGFPDIANAGNVLRPHTAFKLSLRLPPLVEAAPAVQQLKALLEDNAPYQAKVTFEGLSSATGWNAPATTPWFESALQDASQAHYGAACATIGQGGTIPLMNMLSQGFPTAQMMVCGVLGPRSNAHGPNEFLHLDYARRLTAAVAQVITRMP